MRLRRGEAAPPRFCAPACGEVGEYCGDVGEYCGDVGEYCGDVGEYLGARAALGPAGEVGE